MLPWQNGRCNFDIAPNDEWRRPRHCKCNKEQWVANEGKAWTTNRDDEDLRKEFLGLRHRHLNFSYEPLPWKFCGTSCGDMRMTKGWPKYLGIWAKTNELSESIMINKGRRVYGYKSPGYKQWGSLRFAADFPRIDTPLSVPSRFTLVANPPSSYPSGRIQK